MPEYQPSGAYNFYDWKTYDEKGGAQDLRNVYRNAGRLGNQLTDFSSPFYQQYASYLSKVMPKAGLSTYLGLGQAGGGNYTANMSGALELQKAENKRIRDSVNTGVLGFAGQNISMLGQLLGIQAGAAGNIYQGDVQKQINSDNQGGVLDFIGSLAGTLGAAALAPVTGGASLIPTFGNMFGGGGNEVGSYGWTGQGFNYGKR